MFKIIRIAAMDPKHRKILANNRVYLKDNLYVSAEMLSYLRDDKIITEEHEETLMVRIVL